MTTDHINDHTELVLRCMEPIWDAIRQEGFIEGAPAEKRILKGSPLMTAISENLRDHRRALQMVAGEPEAAACVRNVISGITSEARRTQQRGESILDALE